MITWDLSLFGAYVPYNECVYSIYSTVFTHIFRYIKSYTLGGGYISNIFILCKL